MKNFTVEFSLADSEYLTALRLVAGAVCSAADVDVDTLEDFKVCVTESALILKNGGFETLKAVFGSEGGGVFAEIAGFGGNTVEADNELSLALIGALVSDCEIERENGKIAKVKLSV